MATCRCCLCSYTVILALCLIEILLGIIVLLLGILNVFTGHGVFWFELQFGYIDIWVGPLVILGGILYGCYLISVTRNPHKRPHKKCCNAFQCLRFYLCFALFACIVLLVFACLLVYRYKEANTQSLEVRFASEAKATPACYKEDCQLRITLGYGFVIFGVLQIIVTLCLLSFKLELRGSPSSADSDKTSELSKKSVVPEDPRVNGRIVFRSPRLNRYVYGSDQPDSDDYHSNDYRMDDSFERDSNSYVDHRTDYNHTKAPKVPERHDSIRPPLVGIEDMELGMSDIESPDEGPLPPPPPPYCQYVEPEEAIWVPRKLNAYVV